ncbi:MAG: hypothetical protein OEZ13_03035 [Spirochaetia bacterium]|nr:hypothetical protein [Spirochaetia bacterium]
MIEYKTLKNFWKIRKNIFPRIFSYLFFIAIAIFFQSRLLTAQAIETDAAEMVEEKITFMPPNWSVYNSIFYSEHIESMPNGSNIGGMLEYWHPGVILSNIETGGFSTLETINVSAHAESIKWQKYLLNGLDISNPAEQGAPVIYIPVKLINSIQVNSQLKSYANNFGINYITQSNKPENMIYFTNPGFMGGSTLMPSEFDREPGQLWGAADKRRKFITSGEGGFQYVFNTISNMPLRIFYEGVIHQRTFLTHDEYETSKRHTVFLSQALSKSHELLAGYQNTQRENKGVEFSHRKENTLKGGENSALIQLYQNPNFANKISYGITAGISHIDFSQTDENSIIIDLVEEALLRKNPEPEKKAGWFSGGFINLNKIISVYDFIGFFKNTFRLEGRRSKLQYTDDIHARTYYGAPLDITLYDQNNMHNEEIYRWYSSLNLEKQFQKSVLKISAGFQSEAALSGSKTLATKISPAASLLYEYKTKSQFAFTTGMLYDSIPFTFDEIEFLNPQSASGARYVWNDNGDGTPTASETGAVLSRTGGLYHNQNDSLKHPSRQEFFIKAANKLFENYEFGISIHAKRFSDLYMVQYDPSQDNGYYEIERTDVDSGYLFNRDIAAFGSEFFQLTNRVKDGYYAGFEAQIFRKTNIANEWFFAVNAGAYYAEAETIVGNGPDYNDMGQISESSADPNSQINTYARIDFDRAYTVHIIWGKQFLNNFLWSNIIRYRDGQPFGQLLIADGLTQGPVIVQNQRRSDPPKGMPRYTYALSWDTRFVYKSKAGGNTVSFYFDIYNLLDSRSEIYEHTLADEKFRDALETVIGRSYRIGGVFRW